MRSELPDIKRSLLLHVVVTRISIWQLQARAALIIAGQGRESARKRRFLNRARRFAKRLEDEGFDYVAARARLIRVAADWQARVSSKQQVLRRLDDAISRLEVTECLALALAAKRVRGELSEAAEAARLLAEADGWLSRQGVRNPQRFARFLVPGFV